ncbi:hypothetical protein QBC37DRAFT_113683 [Rhypophila decipiens]|uniref:Uncharacterized protein n=1 Tax=Rhypophila decipiens TaxID=261697 RepID=A0AAN6YDP5_9PEZI|nr:hypothetical protein QBC37DRAFT_113683 [Rhypophila decipiens]
MHGYIAMGLGQRLLLTPPVPEMALRLRKFLSLIFFSLGALVKSPGLYVPMIDTRRFRHFILWLDYQQVPGNRQARTRVNIATSRTGLTPYIHKYPWLGESRHGLPSPYLIYPFPPLSLYSSTFVCPLATCCHIRRPSRICYLFLWCKWLDSTSWAKTERLLHILPLLGLPFAPLYLIPAWDISEPPLCNRELTRAIPWVTSDPSILVFTVIRRGVRPGASDCLVFQETVLCLFLFHFHHIASSYWILFLTF